MFPIVAVKTGMTTEYRIAKRYADPDKVLVLTGEYAPEKLDAELPPSIKALFTFGVNGGLAPIAAVGEAFVYSTAVVPVNLNFTYLAANPAWVDRLRIAARCTAASVWSSGAFNTANDEEQRAALFKQTGCPLIDDETYAVALTAQKRSLPWCGLRTVSDGAEDNLPPAVLDALNADGSTNLLAVLKSVEQDPLQLPGLIKTALEAKKAFDALETAAIAIGHLFGWVD